MLNINPFAEIFSTTKIKSLGISLDTFYMGDKLAYKMHVNGVLLFEGTDFKPSPLYNWDDLEANIDLLGFLSCGIHDTDSEYFASYNHAQLDWANDVSGGITIRERLSGLVSDASDKRSEYYKDAIKQFKHKTH
jgi:hypothetical protein